MTLASLEAALPALCGIRLPEPPGVYWRTIGPPDRWPVVLYGRNDDWIEFPGTLTEYLTGLVTGDVPPHGLPRNFPGRSPAVRLLW